MSRRCAATRARFVGSLPSEDDKDLLEEILCWEETGWVIECYRNKRTGRERRIYVERDTEKIRQLPDIPEREGSLMDG